MSTTGSLASTLGVKNPLRYRGYYYDTESGFYYLQSRYYDPNTCRFLNADDRTDAAGGIIGYNLYTYCVNNPNQYADYSGHGIEGVYRGKKDCRNAMIKVIILTCSVSWTLIDFGKGVIELGLGTALITLNLSVIGSAVFILTGFLVCVVGVVYAAYMAAEILTGYSLYKKYNGFRITAGRKWGKLLYHFSKI